MTATKETLALLLDITEPSNVLEYIYRYLPKVVHPFLENHNLRKYELETPEATLDDFLIRFPALMKRVVNLIAVPIAIHLQAQMALALMRKSYPDDHHIKEAIIASGKGLNIFVVYSTIGNFYGDKAFSLDDFISIYPMEFIDACSKVILPPRDQRFQGSQQSFIVDGFRYSGTWNQSGFCYEAIVDEFVLEVIRENFRVFYTELTADGQHLIQYI